MAQTLLVQGSLALQVNWLQWFANGYQVHYRRIKAKRAPCSSRGVGANGKPKLARAALMGRRASGSHATGRGGSQASTSTLGNGEEA